MTNNTANSSPFHRRMAAYAVHAFTASGAVAGLLALLAAGREAWAEAFVWLGAAGFVDAVDGTFARLADVKRHAPRIDGALLDNVVDYFTYVAVPAYMVYIADFVPEPLRLPSAAVMLVASAFQFSQVDAKTPDHYFKGFPSYWNIAVFYLFFLELPRAANAGILAALGVAVFIPILYVYPSRTPVMRAPTLILGALWALCLIYVLWRHPEPATAVLYASLLYIAYYAGLSLYLTKRRAKA